MDSEADQGATGGVAWDDPETRNALGIYRRNSSRMCWIGIAILFAGFIWAANINPNSNGISGTIAAILIGGGLVPAVGGTIGLARTESMRRSFKKYPWLNRRVDYRIATNLGNGEPALRVHPDEHGPESVYSLPSSVWRFRSLPQGSDLPILFINEPGRGAIIAPPDRSIVLFARPPRTSVGRRLLRKGAIPRK